MAAPTRRERLRAATVDEIKQTARRLLVDEGPAAISLRAIARDMGMTAPALYRYFPSHEALMEGVCTDLKLELIEELERARDAAGGGVAERMQAACQAFRGWAIAHPAEFTLMFASTRAQREELAVQAPAGSDGAVVPGPGGAPCQAGLTGDEESAYRFGRVFLDLIVEHYRGHPFPVPEPELFSPELRAQLQRFAEVIDADVPVGVAYVFLSGWVRLYGLVALEVFGHLHFALTDVEPLFDTEMRLLAGSIGLPFDRP